ncbi:hypothetical protein [Paraburkholderia gardini]|uniref:GlsB/YeaQ/YmgE family stress response membrane protein n=1 Tax=Paraburkholderia gardini TaxID=2823469 RepID=A0ABN7QTR6_9BURK|nr:hypothetical protein [Paraburkholderia gardini]CAG4908388.1 hypothetical protein R54767_03503 [Paraburkholderia gardini]CAG4915443.1 hypothetical protein R69919_04304 [Paraburkholderia gardini]
MGWAGIVILGAVVGLVGGWLHPLRRAGRARIPVAMVAGVAGAVVAAMAGNVAGIFHDGDTLEWLACTSVALIAVAVTVGLLSRR